MSRRWLSDRAHDEEPPASPAVSRLFVMGVLIAALLGLLTGVAWLGWHLIMNPFPG